MRALDVEASRWSKQTPSTVGAAVGVEVECAVRAIELRCSAIENCAVKSRSSGVSSAVLDIDQYATLARSRTMMIWALAPLITMSY
jgi:hypothetical protein